MDRQEMDSLLEMHLHGELPPELRRKAEGILATPEGKKRMEQIRESDEAILRELPPEKMARAIERKLSASSGTRESVVGSGSRMGWIGAGGFATALGILALVVFDRRDVPDPSTGTVVASRIDSGRSDTVGTSGVDRVVDELVGAKPRVVPAPEQVAVAPQVDDGIRTKGDARRLRVHRIVAATGEASPLRENDTASPGSVLQVSLLPGPQAWAAVVSVDGSGQATLHVPEAGDSALSIQSGMQAPHSFQLDDAPGFERFFLITSAKRFSLDEALALARRSGKGNPVRTGWSFQSIHVAKPEVSP